MIIDGRKCSNIIKEDLKRKIVEKRIEPCLAVIQIGNNEASNIYVNNKKKACEKVGIKFKELKFPDTISQELVIKEIKRLNNDKSVNGIIVQLPLPKPFDAGVIINEINPLKDVDGLTYENVGNLVLENDCLVSCTPLGVINLLKMYNAKIEGKHVVIVGRSNLVGKPLIQLFLQENATVSVCHSKSEDIKNITKQADILVVAVGHPNLITKDMVKENAIIIDVGINHDEKNLCGDVDFDGVSKKASLITPVPGGVGPMTVACLLKNVVKAYNMQNGDENE